MKIEGLQDRENSMSYHKGDETSGAWKVPELPVALFLCLLVGLLLRFQSPLLGDLDVGWLIRDGEFIWQNWRLPRGDIYSFTYQGQPWVLFKWGFELYLGVLHRLAGLGGVVWGTALLISLTYSLLLYFLLRQGGHRLVSIGLVLLAMLANNFYWLARPTTMTFLFYTIAILLLEDYRRAPGRQLWFLPLLFFLWANLHLGFVVALGAVGLYGLAAWLLPSAFRGPGALRDLRPILLVPLCFAAVCLNPYGPELLVKIWHDSTSLLVVKSMTTEMASPNFHFWSFIPLFAQIALLFWVRGRDYPGRPVLLSLVTVTLGLGLYSARHLPYFSISATLHLAQALMRPGHQQTPAPLLDNRRGWGWGILGMFLSLAVVAGIGHKAPGCYRFEASYVPQGAADYLARQARSSQPWRLFSSNEQWASYFIYRLYPQSLVFIDTRFDLYSDAFIIQFLSLRQEVLENLEVLAPWGVDFVIQDKKGLPAELPKLPPVQPRWRLVYEDQQALVYRHLK